MYNYSNLTIIIPTLNEAKNIKTLIGTLLRRYRGVRIIVADDGSTDGTQNEIRSFGARSKGRVVLLDRSRKAVHGLTQSVIDAAMHVRTRDIIVMDADLQHPPDKVRLLAEALEEYRLVIGVRAEVANWGLYRTVVSKSVSAFCNTVFFIRGKKTSHDIMSGFFGIRAELFKRIISEHGDRYVGRGYKVLLDTLKFIDRDEKVGEVEYTGFHDRVYGKSKANYKILRNILVSTLT
ncbi:MAG: glycosyltransferase [Candidatus Micrarchaeia archaeon]